MANPERINYNNDGSSTKRLLCSHVIDDLRRDKADPHRPRQQPDALVMMAARLEVCALKDTRYI